ncbi:hypothetical protein SLA2020_281280 [Shorea laevis]
MAGHGTHQGMSWEAVAPHGQATNLGWPCHGRGTHQGVPWQAVAHTKACRGLPVGMPLTSVCIAHGHAMASRGTHRGMPWNTPRHATTASRGTHQGMPWHHPLGRPWHTPRHVVAAHGLSWHTAKACHGKPRRPMVKPRHTPRHAVAHTKACRGTHRGMTRHTPRHATAQIKAFYGTHQRTPALALIPFGP